MLRTRGLPEKAIHSILAGAALWSLAVVVTLALPGPRAHADAPLLNDDEQAEVNLSIDRGVKYLKSAQNVDGSWAGDGQHGNRPIGYTCASGLALIECGVPVKDPCIEKAAAWLFQDPNRLGKLTATYELALAIWFLDALGDAPSKNRYVPSPAVRKNAIVTLAMRLVAGQQPSAGWGYNCPILSPEDQYILMKILKQRSDRQTAADDKNIKKPATRKERTIPVPFNLANLTVLTPSHRLAWSDNKGAETCNSNSQFAILALWVARRHSITVKRETLSVPVAATFNLVLQRYRKSQNEDGGWAYRFVNGGGGGSAPAMTCCALIGLATGYAMGIDEPERGFKVAKDAGAAIKGQKPADDDANHRHFGGMSGAQCIKFSDGVDPDPVEKVKAPADQTSMLRGFTYVTRAVGKPAKRMKDLPMSNLYFMWSLERVAVLYNLRELGDRDWYRWGAEILVANQDPSGAWEKNGGYHGQSPVLNTCFALLFLKRANLAMDLTKKLPFEGSMLARDIREAAPQPPQPSPKVVTVPPPTPPPQPAPAPTPLPIRQPVVQQPPPAPAPEPAPQPSNSKLWIGIGIALVAIVLLIAAGILAYMILNKEDKDRPRKKKKQKVSKDVEL